MRPLILLLKVPVSRRDEECQKEGLLGSDEQTDEIDPPPIRTTDRYVKLSFVVLLAVLSFYAVFMLPVSEKSLQRMEMKEKLEIQASAASMNTVFKGDKWPGILGFLKYDHKITRDDFKRFVGHQVS